MKTTKSKEKKAKLIIRPAEIIDAEAISKMVNKAYPNMPPYSLEMISAQITHFPEGHFVAVYDDKICGYCASIIVSEKIAMEKLSWRVVTGNGYGSTHDPNGDYLYGYEVCVDPDRRKLRIGQRFYNQRKKLARYLRLKGIVFAGRLPRLKSKLKDVGSPENYLELVIQKKVRDPILSFQLRNGFEVLGLIKNYLPSDTDSLGYGCHLIWRNPEAEIEITNIKSTVIQSTNNYNPSVRVATIQYGQKRINSLKEFKQFVEYYVKTVSDYKCDFVLFPELFSLQLLSIENEDIKPHQAIEKLTKYAPELKDFYSTMAIKYNINIIGGSHPKKMDDGTIHNVSFVALRDGKNYEQSKIHPTPEEKYWWNISGGDKLNAIDTDCGRIGVLICYDSEFPELSRRLVDQGMKILFVPFLTDERQAYCRVRYCSQARAVENEIYVVMSGSVGNLPRVTNLDIHYSQSCILTPCDFPFSRDGIAQEATPNVEMLAMADLRLDTLTETRNSGTVQNLKSRRHDLYSVNWHG